MDGPSRARRCDARHSAAVNASGSVLVALGWAVVGAGAGWVVRWGSVRLARLEELEPGHLWWQVYGPPVLAAILFGLFGLEIGSFPLLVLRSVFVLVLVQVIFFDLEHRLILDRIMFPSMALALVVSLFCHPWWAGIATGLGAGGLFLLLAVAGSAIFKAAALGFGAVKLAVFLGGLSSIGVIIWRRSMKGTIAYGPYLAAGALIVLFQLPQ